VLWTNCEAAVEIARQLKLRNIGGVVIIDFIDMDSRRDQLQLLEYFTDAVRHDAARPQIAQLTELGLVELTRKRQGQNIYELFGRACPSCGGLGHVAVLPGKDTLQLLATVSGLVRTAASARAEVASPTIIDGGGGGAGRRRRGGRGGRVGGDSSESGGTYGADFAPTGGGISIPLTPEGNGVATDTSPRRQDPELVAVPMDPEQELVYGWMGLSPTLLLDPVPNGDNLLVRVVRPGVDAETVLEEGRQQVAASGSRRRRRGRGTVESSPTVAESEADGENGGGASGSDLPSAFEEFMPMPIEIPVAPAPVAVTTPNAVALPVAVAASGARQGGRPASDGPAPDAEGEDSSEPRRRRRRSSATG
jgi:ribonuclease E